MKINVTIPLKNLDGSDAKIQKLEGNRVVDTDKTLTVRRVLLDALQALPDGRALPLEEHGKRYELLKLIRDNDVPDLTVDQRAEFKRLAAAAGFGVLHVGQISELFEE